MYVCRCKTNGESVSYTSVSAVRPIGGEEREGEGEKVNFVNVC